MIAELSEIGMTLAPPALVGIFTFLWRVNAKLSALDQRVKANSDRISRNAGQLAKHFDKAFTIRKNI